jgi:hypothetical protein
MDMKMVKQGIDIARNKMMEDTKEMNENQMVELCCKLYVEQIKREMISEEEGKKGEFWYKMARGIYNERFGKK